MLAILAAFGCTCARLDEPLRPPEGEATRVVTDIQDLPPGQFEELESGLELGVFTPAVPRVLGDGRIVVVRIDPAHFELDLRTASAEAKPWNRTLDAWAEEFGLSAAINPAMYHADGTSVFYMEDHGRVNQAEWYPDANNLLVARPRRPGLPAWDILDTTCGGSLPTAQADFGILVQSWRLLDCGSTPTWTVDDKIWSHAVVALDRDGRLLLIHSRTPWNTRVFTDILRALPLQISRAMYGEGGPEASLFVRGGSVRLALMGSYETGFMESDDNDHLWPIPNVLGVRRRAGTPARGSAQ